MKKVFFFASVLAIAAITGCGTKPGEAQADGTSSGTPINVNSLPTATSPSSTTTTPMTVPTISAPTLTTPATTTVPGTTTVAAGLNPAHGQPGHRCDIEVGAPLNSAPTTAAPANKTTTTTQPVITTSAPTVVNTPTKPGMNPPHGQPGHRCDIAVGESLTSKPAATTTTTGPTVTSAPQVTPSIGNTTTVTSAPSTAVVGPGMNPAHGQPGHRCDIAVGAPLNSKAEPLKVVSPTTTETKAEPKKEN